MRALPNAPVKLLIVDDEADTRALICEALESCGAQVRASATAEDARRMLACWHPDLLISDLGMPDEDGYALIRCVRGLSASAGAHVPAIACTGLTGAADKARALDAGFDAVVTKPIDIELLMRTIVHVAGVRGSRGGAAGAPSAPAGAVTPAPREDVRARSAPDS